MTFFQSTQEIFQKHLKLTEYLSRPDAFSNQDLYKSYSKELAELEDFLEIATQADMMYKQLRECEELLVSSSDEDMVQLASQEKSILLMQIKELEEAWGELFTKETNQEDNKNVILELRSGTGGEESSLFAMDLMRMYQRFCERKGLSFEMLSYQESDTGGLKEGVASVEGKGSYGFLRYETGVHRVQRIPKTESNGRVHTSAATVAVLPEIMETEVEIRPADLRIDTYRSSGAGGQHVNTTDSAVRITHIPTGVVVTCQDERSQQKNRVRAMKILRSRIIDSVHEKEMASRADQRKNQIGSGDRSERIRTYNFLQSRVTDHRIGKSVHNLSEFMDGDIEEMVEALRQSAREKLLSSC